MPIRRVPLRAREIYHVYNRGIDRRTVFKTKVDYFRMMESLWFYLQKAPPFSLSSFHKLRFEDQLWWQKEIQKSRRYVSILAYCLMPNHFHLLLQPLTDESGSWYMSQIENSYTRYFNTKNERKGQLFENQFKAVRVTSNEQLLHVSRYIHLNPVTASIVKVDQLDNYQYSSWMEYMDFVVDRPLIESTMVLGQFASAKDYRIFVEDRANYQRELKNISHLIWEE
jgi:putative transposase